MMIKNQFDWDQNLKIDSLETLASSIQIINSNDLKDRINVLTTNLENIYNSPMNTIQANNAQINSFYSDKIESSDIENRKLLGLDSNNNIIFIDNYAGYKTEYENSPILLSNETITNGTIANNVNEEGFASGSVLYNVYGYPNGKEGDYENPYWVNEVQSAFRIDEIVGAFESKRFPYFTVENIDPNNANNIQEFRFKRYDANYDNLGIGISFEFVNNIGYIGSNCIIPMFNENMNHTFSNCSNLNQNIRIPEGVTDIVSIFAYCYNLNQNIYIPNNVTNIAYVFYNCRNLNQNIQIPEGVTDMNSAFCGCYSLNQNILIPNNVTIMSNAFRYCFDLNQNIYIPEGVTDMYNTFAFCNNLNQNIYISNSVTNMCNTFYRCNKLNQNIYIPEGVTNLQCTFLSCTNLNQNILIPPNVTDMYKAFEMCTNLNQNIYIYSDKIDNIEHAFSFSGIANKYIHIPYTVPMETSNYIYNSLVSLYSGENWTGRIINDLDPAAYPARGE